MMLEVGFRQDYERFFAEDDLHGNAFYLKSLSTELVNCHLKIKSDVLLTGLPFFIGAFNFLGSTLKVEDFLKFEGKEFKKGEEIVFKLPFSIALTGERIALNLLQQSTKVSTFTKAFLDKTKDSQIAILDTRKTTPGLRQLEKYAVRMAGAYNHRFSQADAWMIKDNHKNFYGGLKPAWEHFLSMKTFYQTIIVEIHSLEELQEAIDLGISHLMLDNFSQKDLNQAILMKLPRMTYEVSGGVNLENIESFIIPGIDAISIGALTHSAPHVDLSMKNKKDIAVKNEYDVLIIGTGIAGLSAAAGLAEKGLKVAIVTREKDPSMTNTVWAQGGIIYAKGSEESLVEDIMKASAGTSSPEVAKFVAYESSSILEDLLIHKAHSNFERDESGELLFTKEAAHSTPRILYRGDYTGKDIQITLLNYLKNNFSNVTFLTSHTAIDLLTALHHGVVIQQRYEENKVLGAYVFNQETKSVLKILAKFTILATGGIGALYLHHTNSEGARGDGHAMAKRAGAVLTDLEFIQFHPTSFFGGSTHRRFLISEAVRGEGGRLINSHGVRFMEKYHVDLELAPRDVVARAIAEEIIETQSDCVYLDITHKDPEWIKNRFPTIYKHCLEHDIDMAKEAIPVVPAAHYTCGGVKTDLKGQTTLKNLYAVGEVACTGLHGANRLASTSLLEGMTFGHFAAVDILKNVDNEKIYSAERIKDWVDGTEEVDTALIHQDWLTLKQTMWNYVGLTRSKDRLSRAEAMFNELSDEINRFYKDAKLVDNLIGLRNAVDVGHQVLVASRRNTQSVGCFYRKS